jgi:hypothetical protein
MNKSLYLLHHFLLQFILYIFLILFLLYKNLEKIPLQTLLNFLHFKKLFFDFFSFENHISLDFTINFLQLNFLPLYFLHLLNFIIYFLFIHHYSIFNFPLFLWKLNFLRILHHSFYKLSNIKNKTKIFQLKFPPPKILLFSF